MPVDDAKQNNHQWWGTLTIDDNTEVVGGSLAPETLCVFVKTSSDAHYITHGTYIKRVKILSNEDAAKEAPIGKFKSNSSQNTPENENRIRTKLSKFSGGKPIVEILEIDKTKTSPLTLALNDYTAKLFNDDVWLDKQGQIGKEDIRLGRDLLPI